MSTELAQRVAVNLGKTVSRGKPISDPFVSEALSILPSEPDSVAGRVVGTYAADGVDGAALKTLKKALRSAGIVVKFIAPHGGTIDGGDEPVAVDKSALVTQSVEYDALVVVGGDGAEVFNGDAYCALNIEEVYRHHKPIAAWFGSCGTRPQRHQ